MKRRLALAAFAAIAIAAGVVIAAGDDDATRAAAARTAFLDVHRVLTSPRCRNCHPAGDAPLQTDDGVPHAQNITRRSVKNGLTCGACHRDENGARAGQPPGAPHWGLPPEEHPMVFEGKPPRALCEQLKDPAQTNGKDLDALFTHVSADPLVLWGWSPGPGRTVPPLAHADFVSAFRTWRDGGAACPD